VENYVEGKVIIITGAAGGFGRLVAQKTASLGASVVASDVNEAELEATCASISAEGGTALAVRADVTSRAEMKALAEQAVARFGAIDVMVNNAGIMPLAFFSLYSYRICQVQFGLLSSLVSSFLQK